MSLNSSSQIKQPDILDVLEFCVTEKHDCGYLPEQHATTLFVNPAIDLQQQHYNYLATVGFRRSGNHLYRPHCEQCQLCVPVRLNVSQFKASKQQRRCWNKNTEIITLPHPTRFNAEHFNLYSRYLNARHSEGGMDPTSKAAYNDIINSHWCESELLEFRRGQQLVAVAVMDKLSDGLSAVYTFFEPELTNLSLGILAIQHQIALVRQRNLSWLYLGYWNPESQKMSYKTRFQPLQYFVEGAWQTNKPY